jgi:hypothetical protein
MSAHSGPVVPRFPFISLLPSIYTGMDFGYVYDTAPLRQKRDAPASALPISGNVLRSVESSLRDLYPDQANSPRSALESEDAMSVKLSKYVIERDLPNLGNLSPGELQAVSRKSCDILQNMGPEIQWVHSYVTQNKMYCVYLAPNEDMIRQHAQAGGFPANKISEVKTVIDPTTAT